MAKTKKVSSEASVKEVAEPVAKKKIAKEIASEVENDTVKGGDSLISTECKIPKF